MKKRFILMFTLLLIPLSADALQPFGEKDISSSAALWNRGTMKDKVAVIAGLIRKYKDGGVVIRKEPEFYIREMERVRGDSVENYTKPIGEVFRALAVMYRDLDNGEDPDALIQQVLGEEEYRFYVEFNEAELLEEMYNDWKASNTK